MNTVVLRHCGVTDRILRHIANTFRIIYTGNFSLEDAVIKIPEQIPMSEEIHHILNFISQAQNGIVRHIEAD